ncbi:MAG: type II secretion system GspH family protein [bacterium]|nr:type II secretion system GspH family protein [bacterium]
MKKNTQKGFTLVELLIVVSVLAILTVMAMANYSGGTSKARDAQRKSDLRAVREALESYKLDKGSYPLAGATAYTAQTASIEATSPGIGETQFSILMSGSSVGLVDLKYLQKALTDPRNVAPYRYRYSVTSATADAYTLETCLENTSDQQRYQNAAGVYTILAPCVSGTNANYRVFNP